MKSIKGIILLMAGIGLSSVAFAQQSVTTTTTKTPTATTTRSTAITVQQGDRTSYRAAKKQADATYKSAKSQCDAMGMKDKGRETCIGVAKAQQRLDKANAEALYKPTAKNSTDARMAAAELDYARAKVQCHNIPGDVRETGADVTICLNKAAEARNQAISAAKTQREAVEEGVSTRTGTTKAGANGTITPGSSMDTRGDIGRK